MKTETKVFIACLISLIVGFFACYGWLAVNKEIKSLDSHYIMECPKCMGHIWQDTSKSECIYCLECGMDIK